MEAPEVHTPHAHPSGNRWLDMALGGSAFIISLVSLWLGIQHGRAMEKLVAANSWPNIEFDTIVDRRGTSDAAELQLLLDNNGIGPARVETLELWHHGVPLADIAALTQALGGGLKVESASVSGFVIGARQKQMLVTLTAEDGVHRVAAFLQGAGAITARVCYCSVFDECYVNDTRDRLPRPQRVKACPVPPQPFRDDLSTAELAAMAAKAP
ncbi:MAG TPA: hypothetical protein PK808_01635 [Polymorphobacter sp.]|nr:hypothetical protein [Polymorphobacter sp.]